MTASFIGMSKMTGIVAIILLLLPKKGNGFIGIPNNVPAVTWRTSTNRLWSQTSSNVRDGVLEVSRTFAPAASILLESEDSTNKRGDKPITENFNISYKVFRPMTLSSQKSCPILICHGGPSVPSDYLFPLVDVVPYRSIIFFDQLGCGRSDEPKDIAAYSIEKGVDDLELLVKKLGLRKFHIFGQSFGGILGYEFIKRIAERNQEDLPPYEVLSIIISSTPTSVPLVEEEVQRLLGQLLDEDDDESTLEERFQLRHICRTPEKPQPLTDAYAHAGTVWRGTHAIEDYAAQPPSEEAAALPPAMIMRGQFDFITEVCSQDWKAKIWNHSRIREKILADCSHHGLLENNFLYGDLVDSFCSEYDP